MQYPADIKTIKLSRPLMTSGGEVTELQMREPTVLDKLAHEKQKGTALEKEIGMIASLCNIEPAELHKVSARDYKKLGEAVNGFLAVPEEDSNPGS